jgi:adenosine deaminase
MDLLTATWQKANRKFSPNTKLILQAGLSRHVPIDLLSEWAEPFFDNAVVASIDLYGDELAQPIENFIPLYKKAKAKGWILRAHVGEWGTADDVMRAVELLELDEVQHGIAAAGSKEVMRFLRQNKIRLNICPTSNLLLGRVPSMKEHPIRKLYDAGVIVTVNTDDSLVFGNNLSDEFFALYKAGLFTAAELDSIRLNGFAKTN